MSTVGEVILSIEFSEPERKRLGAALLLADSLPARVLKEAAGTIHDHRFWKSQQRTFKVTGFRDGNPDARTHVVRRAFEALKLSSEPHNTPLWNLYRTSVQYYVMTKLSALNRLLAREVLSPPPTSPIAPGARTQHIFRTIKQALLVHDVPMAQVKELYELWGFDRFEGIDELLNDQSVDAQVVSRLIANGQSGIKRELATEMEGLRARIDSLVSTQSTTASTTEERLADLRDDVNSRLIALAERFEALPQGAADRRRKPASDPTPRDAKHPLRRDEDTRWASFHALTNELQRQIGDLSRRTAKQEEKVSAVLALGQKRTETTSLSTRASSTVAELVAHTAALLRDKGIGSLSTPATWTLISLMRASRVFVTDQEALVCSPLLCSPKAEIKVVGVSPTWLSQADWAESFEFLAEQGANPRALVLLDFDVAIQEAYLLPSLLVWLSRVYDSSRNRIVLVPSVTDLSQASPRVLEVALVLMSGGHAMKEIARMRQDESFAQKHVASGIPKDFFKCEPFSHTAHREELNKILGRHELPLPTRLLESFVSVDGALRRQQPEDLSGRLAAATTVLPWILRTRGESAAHVAQALFAVLFGKPE